MAELCLLFDSDGTLVDSEILLAEAMSSTLPRYGLPFTSARYMNEFRGMRFMSIVRTLEAAHGVLEEAPTRRMEGEMRALLEELMKARLTAMPDMAAALMELAGYPCGVVSNGP
ncbi:HAD hydrolase-like protein, partial [Pseudoalteromonas sp. SIMBA_162]|uniref:HAD hydrolase-like protein n=1 Tax=Pseudoalteromonas sp. SIMBA_162 TaxID=3080867 RepID=UPI00397A1E16